MDLMAFYRFMRPATGAIWRGYWRHCQDEPRPDALDTAIHGLGHAADGFRPAKCLFDLLPVLLGQGISLMPGGSAIDC
ncbi:hypothetical protein ACSSV6_004237 [Roseovarius sp. MBR-38]|jgi:hypothetical protein